MRGFAVFKSGWKGGNAFSNSFCMLSLKEAALLIILRKNVMLIGFRVVANLDTEVYATFKKILLMAGPASGYMQGCSRKQ